MKLVERLWYPESLPQKSRLLFLLKPLSWLFGVVVTGRRYLYQMGVIPTYHSKLPVIVVGNITVGGTGKTPCVISLVKALCSYHMKPAVITRGYGGSKTLTDPTRVRSDHLAADVGDEALLLANALSVPVIACKHRKRALQFIEQTTKCNVVISDDGLQHYQMGRTLEIALVDETRQFGNGFLLPAGPLREYPSRLKSVDYILNHTASPKGDVDVTLKKIQWVNVEDPSIYLPLDYFAGQKAHAIAAIGHPQRFFKVLRELGIEITEHAFKDHYRFIPHDLNFKDSLPLLMTEKDAIKCSAIARENWWYLQVEMVITDQILQAINIQLQSTLTEAYHAI